MLTDEEVSNQDALMKLAFNDLGSRYLGARSGENGPEPIFSPGGLAPPPSGGAAYDLSYGQPQPVRPGDMSYTYGNAGEDQTLVGIPSKGGSGYAQVQNLSQLKQIMGALQGVPPDLRDRLITQLTGIPFKGERQIALESAQAQARTKHQLEAPNRQFAQDVKLEGLANRDVQQQQTLQYQNEVLRMRDEALQLQKDRQMEMLFKVGQSSTDPQVKSIVAQLLMKQLQMMQGNEAPMEGPPITNKPQGGKPTVRRIR